MDWKPIDIAPFDREVELAVIDDAGVHALTFPCHRIFHGWVNAKNKKRLYNILATHWRDWSPSLEPSASAPSDQTVRVDAEALTQRLAAIHRALSGVNDL